MPRKSTKLKKYAEPVKHARLVMPLPLHSAVKSQAAKAKISIQNWIFKTLQEKLSPPPSIDEHSAPIASAELNTHTAHTTHTTDEFMRGLFEGIRAAAERLHGDPRLSHRTSSGQTLGEVIGHSIVADLIGN